MGREFILGKDGYTTAGLRRIVPGVKATVMNADSDGATVDVLGEIREVEKGLANLRLKTAVEISAGTKGDDWVMNQGRECTRSYNNDALFATFMKAYGDGRDDATLVATILDLVDAGALSFKWNWTKLNELAERLDVSLQIAKHEIADGDEEHVGELWKDGYPSYELI